MTRSKKWLTISLVATVVIGIVLVVSVLYLFNTNAEFKSLFSGSEATGGTLGGSGTGGEEALQERIEFTGKVSMWIFIFITLLQLVALWVGYAVISSIRYSKDPVKLKLRSMDNAEVFFDVPLYFGLFGTVSAFLVMTFSPQSSRLIAYSSTLIGIIFSLFLRLTLQYPLRKKLVRMDALGIEEEVDDDDDDDDDGEKDGGDDK
ncbi:MAG: hypothetical protein E7053_04985 [Lentisphaerae bacterium]|nr:hypothetical protein [Lentisphaerota bacterium]